MARRVLAPFSFCRILDARDPRRKAALAGARAAGTIFRSFFNMIDRAGRKAALAVAVAAGLLAGGCTKVRDHQGYILDDTLIASVQPGVDNRDSVMTTLGRPTFTGQFATNDWYYVSRTTKNLGFNKPRVSEQAVIRVRFDDAGNVASVERRGMEQVVSIDPSGDETPTLGRDHSLLEELFGNIGTVGTSGQQGTTTDNPH
jgi:outer membrane protein assembly factor BamE (lipoprotein component of BamABCDE complex)